MNAPYRIVFGIALPAAALIFAASGGGAGAQEAGGATITFSKPLAEFRIGDLFPRVVDDSFRQTGAAWQEASRALLQRAREREKAVSIAAGQKRREIDSFKGDLKQARRKKDFVAEGTLEGTRTRESMVLEILQQIDRLSRQQREVAEQWNRAGLAMRRFADADERFDEQRLRRITAPDDPKVPDERLDPAGYDTFVKHAEAMSELGAAYRALGAEVEELASRRLKLLEDLDRSGRIQPRR